MRLVSQLLGSGRTELAEVPPPRYPPGSVLTETRCSVISAGTERMLVEFGRAGWLEKARSQPEKVRQVLEKVRTDGLLSTMDSVKSKLDQPLALGYCNAGVVLEVGSEVRGFRVGDRVASNGSHAEVVSVPQNLCARIPDLVSDEEAAFTVISSIALQGIRLVQPTLGESFVVSGLGLIGLITVQLLQANGCRVLGIDPDPGKCAVARQFGAETADLAAGEDPVEVADQFSRGLGVDGVLLTLAAKSNEPVNQAARMCRKRGRIVLVGVTGLELNRAEFYQKELTFQVSCSYGPGRYDPEYEQKGRDYPLGFVRWTEQRNFEAVLELMARRHLDVRPLISHRFPFEDAPKAYDLLTGGSEPYLGILLEYAAEPGGLERTVSLQSAVRPVSGKVRTAVIGAGNYAGRVLIPALSKAGADLDTLANSGGVGGAHYGRKFGFRSLTTDIASLFARDDLDAVVVATRHDSHARYVAEALSTGKHVFVEKPLALTLDELDAIESAYRNSPAEQGRPLLMVGFNRRFSPLAVRLKELLRGVPAPKMLMLTMNAGELPADHWTHDPAAGGGRIVGEACHFIDIARFLVGTPICGHSIQNLGAGPGVKEDTAFITLRFEDGSAASIHYLANGHKSFPKERVEVFAGGRVLQLDNFRELRGWGVPGFRRVRLWRQDKGQQACVAAFLAAVRQGGLAPVPFDELLEISRVTVQLGEAARA